MALNRIYTKTEIVFVAIFILITFIILTTVINNVMNDNIDILLSRWEDNPNDRIRIADNLFRKIDLIGMSKDEIQTLLGPGTTGGDKDFSFKMHNKPFDAENTVIYFLGVDYMDGVYLIISFENDIAVAVTRDIQ